MAEERWVLDATLVDGTEDDIGMYPFCPIAEDGSVMVGMTFVSSEPPGPFAGVVHFDGQEACEAWCEAHPELLERLRA